MASVVNGLYSLRPGEHCSLFVSVRLPERFCMYLLWCHLSFKLMQSLCLHYSKQNSMYSSSRTSYSTLAPLCNTLFGSPCRLGPVGPGSLLWVYSPNQPTCRGVSAVWLRCSWPEATDGALHERISTVSFPRLQFHISTDHSLNLNAWSVEHKPPLRPNIHLEFSQKTSEPKICLICEIHKLFTGKSVKM